MAILNETLRDAATAEGEVHVDISYDIIRHVSTQLYTNPRKAIEELVCNSYDAGATVCHVKLPKQRTDPLIVLDNGESMDFAGLEALWMVAKSPKQPDATGRRVDKYRMQIGKFGVGKLAAYALGRTPTMGTQGSTDGRNHWPSVLSVCLAGGGLRHGQVIGSTEKDGGHIKTRPVTPADLAATIYQHMEVPLDTTYLDPKGRPNYIVQEDGRALAELW